MVGNCLPATGPEGKLWYGALLKYFLRKRGYISLLVWQVQQPGWPERCQRSASLLASVCPSFLLRRVVPHPGRYLLSVMSGHRGDVMAV